jgi:hypothetical protein
MIIQSYDSVGRYLVASESPKNEDDHYLVDLLAWEGAGQCSCADWDHRIGPFLRAGEPPVKRFCKHIISVRERFCDDVIARMLNQMKEESTDG